MRIKLYLGETNPMLQGHCSISKDGIRLNSEKIFDEKAVRQHFMVPLPPLSKYTYEFASYINEKDLPLNTKIICGGKEYYCYLNWFRKKRVIYWNNNLWIQKNENMKWTIERIIYIALAIAALALTWVSIRYKS